MNWIKKIGQVLSRKNAGSQTLYQSDVYDLQDIYQKMNQQYFNNSLDLSIKWFGRKKTSRRIKRKVLGYYDGKNKIIKIHHSLNSSFFPPYFIAYVVYHEMLHHVAPPIKGRYRRSVHHREFRQKEKLFHSYDMAKEWEKQNLHKILHGRYDHGRA